MAIRAKFYVTEIKKNAGYSSGTTEVHPLFSVRLAPVAGGTEEDKAFWASTPQGTIEMNVVNPAAAEQFELGRKYYIDFTPTE